MLNTLLKCYKNKNTWRGQVDDVHFQVWSQQHCGKWRTFMEPQKAMSMFEGGLHNWV
jgi:hypothetical protein